MNLFFNYKSIPERLVHCGCPLRPSRHQWAAVFVGLWIKGAVGWQIQSQRLGTGRLPAERANGWMQTVDRLLKNMCSFGKKCHLFLRSFIVIFISLSRYQFFIIAHYLALWMSHDVSLRMKVMTPHSHWHIWDSLNGMNGWFLRLEWSPVKNRSRNDQLFFMLHRQTDCSKPLEDVFTQNVFCE